MAPARPPVPVGRIVRPHGLRGEVHVALYGDGAVLEGQAEVLVAGAPRRVALFRRGGPGRAVLRLDGVDGRDGAEALRDAELALPADAFPAPAADEFWHHDLVGRTVADGARVLGRLVEIVNYGASDLLVVEGDDGEWMIPAVEGVLLSTAGERIEVALPEGLEPEPPAAPRPRARR